MKTKAKNWHHHEKDHIRGDATHSGIPQRPAADEKLKAIREVVARKRRTETT
jgi:hypothetical protein